MRRIDLEYQTLFNKSIRFQKIAITNTLAIISTIQQHGEAFLKASLEQNPLLSEGSRKAYLFWADACTRNIENIKTLTAQGLTEVERLSDSTMKPHNGKARKTPQMSQSPPPLSLKEAIAVNKSTKETEPNFVKKTARVEKAVPLETPSVGKAQSKDLSEVKKPAAIQAKTSGLEPKLSAGRRRLQAQKIRKAPRKR